MFVTILVGVKWEGGIDVALKMLDGWSRMKTLSKIKKWEAGYSKNSVLGHEWLWSLGRRKITPKTTRKL